MHASVSNMLGIGRFLARRGINREFSLTAQSRLSTRIEDLQKILESKNNNNNKEQSSKQTSEKENSTVNTNEKSSKEDKDKQLDITQRLMATSFQHESKIPFRSNTQSSDDKGIDINKRLLELSKATPIDKKHYNDKDIYDGDSEEEDERPRSSLDDRLFDDGEDTEEEQGDLPQTSVKRMAIVGEPLAKLIEREGVFMISIKHNAATKKKKITFSMEVSQVRRSVLEPFAAKLGGTIHKNTWGNNAKIVIREPNDIIRVLKFFKMYRLRSIKRIALLRWYKAHEFTKAKRALRYTPNYGESFSR